MTKKPGDLTRRRFMQVSAATAAGIGSSGTAWPKNAALDRTGEHGDPLGEFDYGQVGFHPGPRKTQLEQTHSVLMGLDEDGLMRPFKMAAGLPVNSW